MLGQVPCPSTIAHAEVAQPSSNLIRVAGITANATIFDRRRATSGKGDTGLIGIEEVEVGADACSISQRGRGGRMARDFLSSVVTGSAMTCKSRNRV